MELRSKLSVVYLVFIVALIVLVNSGRLGAISGWVHLVPYGDKVGHFFLMGLLALAVWTMLGARSAGRRVRMIGVVGLTVLVGLEEISQIWLPARRFDPADLLADVAGIAVFTLIARTYAERSVSRSQFSGQE